MKFEIKIKEQLVNPVQLGAWKEDLEYGDFEMVVGEVEDEVYLNDCILVFNKSTWEITVWYISLHKDTFKAEIEFMYNLQECMGIDYENRKPILEWIYQSLSFDNINDCIKRLS